ncbi:MAG: hypothetical protein AAF992_17310, partial [Bacteroidota bacterium]
MINKFLLFIVLSIVATACDQPDKSGQKNAISKWGLLETVNISDTIQLQGSPQELKYTFIPQRTHDRYQIKIFFPSAHSN